MAWEFFEQRAAGERCEDQWQQLFLITREGSFGFSSAPLCHGTAYLAAWEAGVKSVAEGLGAATAADLETVWPA